ncbi:MAG: hypothetical protein IKF14_02920 [Atopobiaceae bacterium]|nr:hypothetical protein [Atopobiaceae bacterium]
MPIPIIVGVAAAVAATGGIGSGVHGAMKFKGANETMNRAKELHKRNVQRFETQNKKTLRTMDRLGKKELEVLDSFGKFSDLIERIQNRPEFKPYDKGGVSLPTFDPAEIKEASIGAGVLLGGMGGAALGTAGGVAASGATMAAVMALGTASTGTAIASLSGVAATNAALAALGGGAIAAGGGGIAAGTAVLGASTLGVGLLVGGVIFNVVGSSMSSKAHEGIREARREEQEVTKVVGYLRELSMYANKYYDAICKLYTEYERQLARLDTIVNVYGKTNWHGFFDFEKRVVQNLVLLVSILYQMGKVNLVKQNDETDGMNEINVDQINDAMGKADKVLDDME